MTTVEQWKNLYEALGYTTEREMFKDLYSKLSLQQMAEKFTVSTWMVKKKLAEHGIAVRPRGGPHHSKVHGMDEALCERIKNEGIVAVAKDLGVSKSTLFNRRRQFREEQEAARQGPGQMETVPPTPGQLDSLRGPGHEKE